jgi:hypothetical protein
MARVRVNKYLFVTIPRSAPSPFDPEPSPSHRPAPRVHATTLALLDGLTDVGVSLSVSDASHSFPDAKGG